jgi:hypothetical protein
MSIISNLQSFTSGASGVIGPTAKANFKRAMDTVMVDLGRDIEVHLEAARTDCTDPDCEYDSFYERHMSSTGAVCDTCKGQGFYVEPRQTFYRANIRWTDEPFNLNRFGSKSERNMEFGRFGVNFVRTKTVETSYDHIKRSIGATIDGINVELFEQPRYTAFGDVLYVVTFWQVMSN